MTITLTTFIPGTKAKADEVNANFSVLKEAIEAKASMDGDSTQTFLVADATESNHAVNKGQLETFSDSLSAVISKNNTRFCVHSGNTTSGEADLFSYSGTVITPKISGTYKNLVISDYEGTQVTISSTPDSLILTGNNDGTYNIFITPAGKLYILNNTIYTQKARPTMTVNDIWLNTSVDPFTCIKYTGSTDEIFYDVPLGSAKLENGAITEVKTFPFNQNGYNLSVESSVSLSSNLSTSIANAILPDYSNGISKTWGTVYQAESNGILVFIDAGGGVNSAHPKVFVGTSSTTVTTRVAGCGNDSAAFENAGEAIIPKGIYYKGTGGYNPTLTFFPCLAEE